jgi:cell wall-associated NlpC family hydrolase
MKKSLATATLLALLCAGPLHAAPDVPAGDAVVQLLQDKGLLPSAAQMEASPIVQQMRDTASDLVMQAMNFLGVPYRRGGNTADQGFDCSGFTRYVFENSIGLVLPRRADEQAKSNGLLNVKREELKPGDLVFFNTMRRAFSHVGIYVGEGKFIHAPRAGGEVRVEDMRQAYWSKRFNGARRAEVPAPDTTATTARPPQ